MPLPIQAVEIQPIVRTARLFIAPLKRIQGGIWICQVNPGKTGLSTKKQIFSPQVAQSQKRREEDSRTDESQMPLTTEQCLEPERAICPISIPDTLCVTQRLGHQLRRRSSGDIIATRRAAPVSMSSIRRPRNSRTAVLSPRLWCRRRSSKASRRVEPEEHFR